jgi:hypothetical protein
MADNLEQVMIRASAEDIAVIDALAKQDGYETRSAWIRFHLRKVINSRRSELVSISTLPHPIDGQPVPVLHVQGR